MPCKMHKDGERKKMNLYKFFDHFGIIIWSFLIIDSIFYLKSGIIDWRVYSRLIVGIGGFLVDGFLVFSYNTKK